MSDVWRDFLFASFFAAAFAFNLWAGKTHLFPLATYDREEEYSGFWLAQGLLAAGAVLGTCFGVAAAL